jgi:hypothetical protein
MKENKEIKLLFEKIKERKKREWSEKEKEILSLLAINGASINDVLDFRQKYFPNKSTSQLKYRFYNVKESYAYELKRKENTNA